MISLMPFSHSTITKMNWLLNQDQDLLIKNRVLIKMLVSNKSQVDDSRGQTYEYDKKIEKSEDLNIRI